MSARSALSVRRFDVSDIPDQTGKTILITGANNGLGLHAATALAGAGARIVLACRNQTTGRAALDAVRARSQQRGSDADHRLIQLDLADLASVRDAGKAALDAAPALDVLINNAGLMAVPFGRTADGFEMQIGTNHLGHFALTDALLPALLATPAPRVVTLSSIAHRGARMDTDDFAFEHRRYDRMGAYGQSKLANLLFAGELARRAETAGAPLTSVAAHPGVAAPNLFDEFAPPIPGAKPILHAGLRVVGNSESRGALSQLYAATMPDVRNGDYLGPTLLFGTRGPVRRSPRSRSAQDENLARRLWERSVELTGADYAALDGR